jgi:hypothetical protein
VLGEVRVVAKARPAGAISLDDGTAVWGASDAGGLSVDIAGGAITRSVSTSWGGALGVDGAVLTVTDVDLGTGGTDNSPDDVYGCTTRFGAGASFTYDLGAGLLCE